MVAAIVLFLARLAEKPSSLSPTTYRAGLLFLIPALSLSTAFSPFRDRAAAALTLTGYVLFSLSDYQLDVYAFSGTLAIISALMAAFHPAKFR